MRYLVLASSLLAVVSAAVIGKRGEDDQVRLCPHLPVKGGGCIRYVRGFDITGVATEVDLKFPQVKSMCDCAQACIDRKETCNNYVWKFTDAASVQSGYRTCTLCTTPSFLL